jgi:predicted DNA-binding transcriptional regulator AlpA
MPATVELTTPQRLLKRRAAAATLSVSERTLFSLSYPRGPIPVVRVGRSVRYDPRDLEEWIQASKLAAQGSSDS